MADSIQETFEQERDRLLGFIRNRVRDIEDAEDILQDVFTQYTRFANPLEPIENASAWLFRVARNRITDWYRKSRAESFSSVESGRGGDAEGGPLSLAEILPDTANHPESLLLRKVIMETLEEALDELPEAQRQVFVWHELENHSFKEIAAMTEVPVNTLLSRKRYAIQYLRDRLHTLYEEL
ncbi:MAG: sigma-70 family RNA polymerase sigma factor [Bacteroidota bacterium]